MRICIMSGYSPGEVLTASIIRLTKVSPTPTKQFLQLGEALRGEKPSMRQMGDAEFRWANSAVVPSLR